MKFLLFIFAFSPAVAADKDYDELVKALGVEERKTLICSCKKPAFVMYQNIIELYIYSENPDHLNEMAEMACKGELELPGVDTYDTSQANNHPCPVDL